VAAFLLALLCAAPLVEDFDGPLDPGRWYVGTGQTPRDGKLRLEKGAWIAARGVQGGKLRGAEIRFSNPAGTLKVSFHTSREPLSSPLGEAIHVARGKGARRLIITETGVRLDGEPLDRKGATGASLRLAALRGKVDLLAVTVTPAPPPPKPAPGIEVVHAATTPLVYRRGKLAYERVSLLLWDTEVCFLLHHGEDGFDLLRAPVRGAPVLGALVGCGDGRALARKAGSDPLAGRDWADERRNLSPAAFRTYLAREYATFTILAQAQRALNAALPEKRRRALEPLVWLAVIRHAPSARAAAGLARRMKARRALAALERALGKGRDLRRASAADLRAAAGKAAREILGDPPPQWPGFAFDPANRFATMQQARELSR